MSQFIQLHLLTAYPPANLNRDDQGRPKTAKMGGTDRLRVSSQSLKRTWRTSDLFAELAKGGHVGTRTKLLGVTAFNDLIAKGIKEKDALKWAEQIAAVFGKCKKKDAKKPHQELEIEQLVHISPTEQQLIDDLVAVLANEQREPEKEELTLLRQTEQAVDIALFGRMLANHAANNVEAACQVAHAISVHPVLIEDDYFTAVDDLNQNKDDAGAAHIGEAAFAAGLFYSYLCINKTALINTLDGNKALADQAICALTEAAIKVAPKGKQNSYGSRAYASYVLAEMGEQQPRTLSAAFLKAIDSRTSDDYAKDAIAALVAQYQAFDAVYGQCAETRCEINVIERTGSMDKLLAFVSE